MEITETVILVKCSDYAKMSCFAMFLAKMPRFLCFFLQFFSFLISINYSLLCDFDTKKYVFATATKVRMFCYLLAQYVTVTSSPKYVF